MATYQTLPWDYRGWHCGSGPLGSANDTHISFEICEDTLQDQQYFTEVYLEAVELCVFLCARYGLRSSDIIDHAEGHALGIASNHGDVRHWFSRFGESMDSFRETVALALEETAVTKELYRVRRSWQDSAGQIGAFIVLENAQALADQHPGFSVYNSNGMQVYPGHAIYEVAAGDSLWGIAERLLGSGPRFKEIMEANAMTDHTIYTGQFLKIPKC